MKESYSLQDCGCYVDSARGRYAIDEIARFARTHGWVDDLKCPCLSCESGGKYSDCEWANDTEDEIDEYMNNNYHVEGAYWGRSEQGDWGLWSNEDA